MLNKRFQGLIKKRSPEQPNLLGIGAERNGFDPD